MEQIKNEKPEQNEEYKVSTQTYLASNRNISKQNYFAGLPLKT